MIKGGALLYAMFLVIVITIISSSFILANYYNNAYIIRCLKKEKLYQDINSGINYGLSLHQEIPIKTKMPIDLYGDGNNKIILQKKVWGAFYMLSAAAKWKNNIISKTALVGANIIEGENIALYLTDQNKPLSLTGSTQIIGDCYLPKAGVKRAYIEGKSFLGNKLITGEKYNSTRALPPLNRELIQRNYTNFLSLDATNDSIVDYDLFLEKDSIINSFENKTLVVYSPFSIVLSDKIVEGNIIIKSDQQIIVQQSTSIENAILYAKEINIERNTIVNAQFFAQNAIHIAENCRLNYPTVVALIGKGRSVIDRKIQIKENTEIKGTVFLYNENYDRNHLSSLSIAENSTITGQVYSSELLELKGTVLGGVFCKNLILKTLSSVYENHLMDAIINRERLSEHFVGVPLTKTIEHQKIIKWLN